MPLWKIYTPVGAYSPEDKKGLSETISAIYAQIPIPKFYVVTIFEEVAAGNLFVGGVENTNFVRFAVDHIARTLPGAAMREWWSVMVHRTLQPWVKDRGFDWEFSYDETPADLWTLQGELPPPFESIAEKRWVKENKSSPYTIDEKLPNGAFLMTPGVRGGHA